MVGGTEFAAFFVTFSGNGTTLSTEDHLNTAYTYSCKPKMSIAADVSTVINYGDNCKLRLTWEEKAVAKATSDWAERNSVQSSSGQTLAQIPVAKDPVDSGVASASATMTHVEKSSSSTGEMITIGTYSTRHNLMKNSATGNYFTNTWDFDPQILLKITGTNTVTASHFVDRSASTSNLTKVRGAVVKMEIVKGNGDVIVVGNTTGSQSGGDTGGTTGGGSGVGR